MKRIEIRHVTRYGFPSPVSLGPHVLLLRPREGHDLRIVSSVLDITPEAAVIWRRDLYDNVLGVATFEGEAAAALEIESRLAVEVYDIMPLDFLVEEYALYFPFAYRPDEDIGLGPYLKPVHPDHAGISQWLEPYRLSPNGTETFSVLDRMNSDIHSRFAYEVREEEGVRSFYGGKDQSFLVWSMDHYWSRGSRYASAEARKLPETNL
jgi:hypothetical protein